MHRPKNKSNQTLDRERITKLISTELNITTDLRILLANVINYLHRLSHMSNAEEGVLFTIRGSSTLVWKLYIWRFTQSWGCPENHWSTGCEPGKSVVITSPATFIYRSNLASILVKLGSYIPELDIAHILRGKKECYR